MKKSVFPCAHGLLALSLLTLTGCASEEADSFSLKLIVIDSVEPACAEPGSAAAFIEGSGFGAKNVTVTVGGFEAEVLAATGQDASFVVPDGIPPGEPIEVVVMNPGGRLATIQWVACGFDCSAIDCDDGNECTADTCDPVVEMCVHTPVGDGTACDFDGLPGVCIAGLCEECAPPAPDQVNPFTDVSLGAQPGDVWQQEVTVGTAGQLVGVDIWWHGGNGELDFPVLLLVGASAARGMINPVGAVAAVTFGALIAESIWFTAARWRGDRLVNVACGLASNPNICIVGFAQRVQRSGASLLIVAKFLPAGGSVPAIAAGLAGTRYRRFLLFDAIAVLLWSSLYVLAGGVFENEVHAIVVWASARATAIVVGLLAVFAAAVAWRVIKTQRHRAMHAAHAGEWPIPGGLVGNIAIMPNDKSPGVPS